MNHLLKIFFLLLLLNVPHLVYSSGDSISVYGTNLTCNGICDGTAGVIIQRGTGPFGYSWAPGNFKTASISALCPGLYTYTVTDSSSMSVITDTIRITEPKLIASTVKILKSSCGLQCDGSAVVEVAGGTKMDTCKCPDNYPLCYVWCGGGTGNGGIVWSNGATGPTATGLCPGLYTITLTDDRGCANYTEASIYPFNSPKITTSSTPATTGNYDGSASANVTSGTPAYTYFWSPGGYTGQTYSGLSCNNYSLTVTDASGCTSSVVDTIHCAVSTGIGELNAGLRFSIFPNPARNNLTIRTSTSGLIQISLINLLGQTVYYSIPSVSSSYPIDVGELPKGVYILQVQDLKTGMMGRQRVVLQ